LLNTTSIGQIILAKKQAKKVEQDVQEVLPFHLTFPIHLNHKDGKVVKDCFFKDEIDAKKYIKRYKLKTKDYTLTKTKPR
jgi:hypothetical protein